MKKKKSEKSKHDAAIVSVSDIKSLIRENALFFDNLIELIPAKFYLPSDEPKPWFQGLSKAAKASAKQQNKEHKKIIRRERLDPEKSQTTTLDLLKQSIEKEREKNESDNEEEEDDDEEEEDIKPIKNFGGGDDKSVTYDELRQRLHRRLEEMRGDRFGSEESKAIRREKKDIYLMNKRKRMSENGEKNKKVVAKAETEKHVEEAASGIQFGKVKLGGEDESELRKNKRRKLSKEKELERAMSLAEEKKDPEKGKKHSWTAALSRASGVKVHDDPKLLKQRMHKEKKKHEKNVEKWKDRIETKDKMKKDKQKKRTDNISGKIHEKKMKKIAKREKKLMRPGFEGRKEGYITTTTEN
ncbi:ribosomal RNA-processing protein 14-like [Impatiens glandulifera]|uniref:ribosomal RNA-processing protein 14-like n=1 Tax=Impatiens glandulifera TaxID=253017 RepID=UPI001FB1A0B8|nr:ribosomal RNA-processing protein 14-like [Impatiens glandulifera]